MENEEATTNNGNETEKDQNQGDESGRDARAYAWEETPIELDAATEMLIKELEEELSILGDYKHASQLIKNEIARLKYGREGEYIDLDSSKQINVVKKLLVPVDKDPTFNYMGKLLGPGGRTLKQLTLQARCRLYILGQGSSRAKEKEPELLASGEPKYAHLAEPLHVRCETTGPVSLVYQRLGFVLDQMKFLLFPDQSEGQGDYGSGTPGSLMGQGGQYSRGGGRYGQQQQGYGGGRGGGGYGGGSGGYGMGQQGAYGSGYGGGYGQEDQGGYYVSNTPDWSQQAGAYAAAGGYGGGMRGGKSVGSYAAGSDQYSAPGKMRGGGRGRGGMKMTPY